jgi:hypothetical protein
MTSNSSPNELTSLKTAMQKKEVDVDKAAKQEKKSQWIQVRKEIMAIIKLKLNCAIHSNKIFIFHYSLPVLYFSFFFQSLPAV